MTIQDLVEAADIVDYIGRYTDLELRSDGEYWGLSPFTNEKTPSFSINKEDHRFYDFSSGCGGNILTFIQKHERCGIRRAIDILKNYVGADGEVITRSSGKLETTQILRSLADTQRKDVKCCTAKTLPDDYMDRFIWDVGALQPWLSEGISEHVLFDWGVRYDPYSECIVYPVWDERGKIFTVGMRTLRPNYKELKIPKYIYSNPIGTMSVVYGYHKNIEQIRRTGHIILFEGAKSVMKMASYYGCTPSAALLTSHLNDNQYRLIAKTGVSCVIAVDSDVLPWEDKNIQRLTRICRVEMVLNRENILAAKESPVDHGKDIWEYLYQKRSALN